MKMDKVKRLGQFACVLLIISCGTTAITTDTARTTTRTTAPTIGIGPTTTGTKAPTIGIGPTTTGTKAPTIGIGPTTTGTKAPTIGIGPTTTGTKAPTIGIGPKTTRTKAPTIGIGPTTTGTKAPTNVTESTTTDTTATTNGTLTTAQTTWGLPSNTSLSSDYVKFGPDEEICVPLKKVSDSSNCTEQDILANITVQSFGACVKACLLTSGCVCLAIEQTVKDNFTLGSCVLGNLGTYDGNLEYVLYETTSRIKGTN